MKSWMIVFAAALLVSVGAIAGEPGGQGVGTSQEREAFDWAGFYIGVSGGAGGGEFLHPFSLSLEGYGEVLAGSLDRGAHGTTAGVQAGFDQVHGGLLLGVVADIQAAGIDARYYVAATDADGAVLDAGDTLYLDAGTRLDWFGSLRGRAGWVFDPVAVYVTAGPAWGVTTSSARIGIEGDPPQIEASLTSARWGFSAGAGIEFAIGSGLSLTTEYLYTDFGTATLYANELLDGVDASLGVGMAFHAVRAGVNLHF